MEDINHRNGDLKDCSKFRPFLGAAKVNPDGPPRDPLSVMLSNPAFPCKYNFFEDYKLLNDLFDGGNGKIFLGERISDGLSVIVKRTPVNTTRHIKVDGYHELPVESQVMHHLGETGCVVNIIDLYSCQGHYFYVMNHVTMASDLHLLTTMAGSMHELLAKFFLQRLAQAIKVMADRGFKHGDIKCENILVDCETLTVKLIDFGATDIVRPEGYSTLSGTLYYMPPEYFLFNKYTADGQNVFSFGVTMYSVLFGRLPFRSSDEIVNGLRYTPNWNLTPECADLLIRCLNVDPISRLTLDEVLCHPWLQEHVPHDLVRHDVDNIVFGFKMCHLKNFTADQYNEMINSINESQEI